MHDFDNLVVKFMGIFARQSELADKIIIQLFGMPSVKLLPLVTCLWVIWFVKEDRERARLSVFIAAAGSVIALIFSRAIQNWGPERPRPLHSGNPDYVAPYYIDPQILKNWSSFPSDNAALSFALSTGIFFFSKPLGFAAYLWSLVFVCFPRIYGGLHYTTDIAFGALVGILSCCVFYYLPKLSKSALDFTAKMEQKYTGAFYALSFIASYQIVTMFADIRAPARSLMESLSG